MRYPRFYFVLFAAVALLVTHVFAQGPVYPGATPTQGAPALYALTPISATGAVNTAITLTIPAPPAGMYNYICKLGYNLSNDTTGTVATNVVSTSTNFNSFAVKTSQIATASIENNWMMDFGTPATGCARSTASATATTFVSPASVTHAMWTWYAAYFQAP